MDRQYKLEEKMKTMLLKKPQIGIHRDIERGESQNHMEKLEGDIKVIKKDWQDLERNKSNILTCSRTTCMSPVDEED